MNVNGDNNGGNKRNSNTVLATIIIKFSIFNAN